MIDANNHLNSVGYSISVQFNSKKGWAAPYEGYAIHILSEDQILSLSEIVEVIVDQISTRDRYANTLKGKAK